MLSDSLKKKGRLGGEGFHGSCQKKVMVRDSVRRDLLKVGRYTWRFCQRRTMLNTYSHEVKVC